MPSVDKSAQLSGPVKFPSKLLALFLFPLGLVISQPAAAQFQLRSVDMPGGPCLTRPAFNTSYAYAADGFALIPTCNSGTVAFNVRTGAVAGSYDVFSVGYQLGSGGEVFGDSSQGLGLYTPSGVTSAGYSNFTAAAPYGSGGMVGNLHEAVMLPDGTVQIRYRVATLQAGGVPTVVPGSPSLVKAADILAVGADGTIVGMLPSTSSTAPVFRLSGGNYSEGAPCAAYATSRVGSAFIAGARGIAVNCLTHTGKIINGTAILAFTTRSVIGDPANGFDSLPNQSASIDTVGATFGRIVLAASASGALLTRGVRDNPNSVAIPPGQVIDYGSAEVALQPLMESSPDYLGTNVIGLDDSGSVLLLGLPRKLQSDGSFLYSFAPTLALLQPVPEPSAVEMFGAGLAALGLAIVRKRRRDSIDKGATSSDSTVRRER